MKPLADKINLIAGVENDTQCNFRNYYNKSCIPFSIAVKTSLTKSSYNNAKAKQQLTN